MIKVGDRVRYTYRHPDYRADDNPQYHLAYGSTGTVIGLHMFGDEAIRVKFDNNEIWYIFEEHLEVIEVENENKL
jgi:hypothetical protein